MANFCIKCGFKLNDADIFCRNCGAKVKVHYSSAYLKSTIYEELEAKKILQAIKSSMLFQMSYIGTICHLKMEMKSLRNWKMKYPPVKLKVMMYKED